MPFLTFFQWCSNTVVGTVIRDSTWLFPVIETFHLLGLGVLGGTILIVDLRLAGFGLRRVPAPELAREVNGWMLGGLAVILVSGVLLFLSEPLKCYDNAFFWIKIGSLLLALAFTFTVRRSILGREPHLVTARQRTLVALTSFALWAGVGIAGRGIAFY